MILLAAEGLVLLLLLIRFARRRRPWPMTGGGVSAIRHQRELRKLSQRLDRVSEDLESRLEASLAELNELLSGMKDRSRQRSAAGDPQEGAAGSDPPGGGAKHPRPGKAAAGQPAGSDGPAGDDLPAKIRHLAAQGNDSVEIARQLDRPIGEVELILSLQRSAQGGT